ncbi:Uncharacterised protein [Acinetobacter baumannii]|nr:Uncharacterised protein [Acinetobacter baumannii]
MQRNRVDLPEPEGPRITVTEPAGMVRLMFFNTSVPEKDFRTRLMWMDALIVHLPEGLCG